MSEALNPPGNPPANPLRGEVAITLDGQAFVMRPTFAAIMEIETELGGVVPLARRAAAGDFGLRDLAVVIRAGLNGAADADDERRVDLDHVGEMIIATGVANVTGPVRDLLTRILGGEP